MYLKCPEGLVLSPSYCYEPGSPTAYEATPVPVPGVLPLLLIGLAMIKIVRRGLYE